MINAENDLVQIAGCFCNKTLEKPWIAIKDEIIVIMHSELHAQLYLLNQV